MELVVQNYELPKALTFNYEELKAELVQRTHVYETMVYGDDQIKEAKSDRANLNKLKKVLTDERIRREKEYMEPFSDFKNKINEIISIIDKPVAVIDAQIKEYEQKKKDEKKAQIVALFTEAGLPEYVTLDKVWDERWLNSTVSLARVKEDIKDIEYRNNQHIETLSNLPEFSFEAIETYKKSLDVADAITTANKLSAMAKAKKAAEEEAARRKAEEEAAAREAAKVVAAEEGEIPFAEPEKVEKVEAAPEEPERSWIKFEALLSMDEAKELNAFFTYNKIAFRAIR